MDKIDATRLGVTGTVEALQQLVVSHFNVPRTPGADEPLFAGGLDLTSLQGLSLIIQVEKKFGVRINELETSIQEIATLSRLARHLMKLSEQRQ